MRTAVLEKVLFLIFLFGKKVNQHFIISITRNQNDSFKIIILVLLPLGDDVVVGGEETAQWGWGDFFT